MKAKNPRIGTALLSIDPTAKRPAWHGCPTALGVLRGLISSKREPPPTEVRLERHVFSSEEQGMETRMAARG